MFCSCILIYMFLRMYICEVTSFPLSEYLRTVLHCTCLRPFTSQPILHRISILTTLVSRHFSKIKAIWLAFDSLNYFTTFDFKRFKFDGVRGLVIFREGIRTLNIRSTLREPFDFILLFVL